jgi:hypothetical protein
MARGEALENLTYLVAATSVSRRGDFGSAGKPSKAGREAAWQFTRRKREARF